MRFFLNVTGCPMRWALVTFFCLWVVQGSGWAHSSDFVFARWTQDAGNGTVELSLSLQISDNPNIESREQALEVLRSLMQVSRGGAGEFVRLSEVAAARLEDRTSFPQDSPVPIGGAGLEELESGQVIEQEEGKKHQILTLIWQWKPEANERQLRFFLAKDCQQYVVFWWAGGKKLAPGKEVPWQIMLGGDESFPVGLERATVEGVEEVEVEEAVSLNWGIWLGGGSLLLFGYWVFRRKEG